MEGESLATAAETANNLTLWYLIGEADIVVKTVMILLVIMSVVSWTLWFSKGGQFKKVHKRAMKFEEGFFEGKELAEASSRISADQATHPMAKLYLIGQEELRQNSKQDERFFDRLRRQLGTALTRELEALETGLTTLATIGSSAPFIGLFGTVWGIMNAFIGIGASKNTSLAVVAPGVAEALFATALGLFAAIPAVIAYNRLSAKLGRYASRLEAFADDYLRQLEHDASNPKSKSKEAA